MEHHDWPDGRATGPAINYTRIMEPNLRPGADPYYQIAELYDLEHDQFEDDIELLQDVAEESSGPILEMGCGSGRVLVPLAESGHRLVGIDQSGPMLERAGQRATRAGVSSSISLQTLDLSQPAKAKGGPFGLVLYTLNALMHLPTQQAQITSLASAHDALASDGTLFLDLMNPAPDYLHRLEASTLLEWSGNGPDGTTVDKWAHRSIDPIEQVIDTTIWYDLFESNGEFRRFRTSFTLRYLHLSEIMLMLESIGFSSIQTFGSYQLDPLDGASERMIITAGKP
jgi:SAM-dependent methyltransferase